MLPPKVSMHTRKASDSVFIVDIQGEITASAENVLMDAYTQATSGGAKAIILNFSQLSYMNSSGIGLLVTLLIRANRQKQQLMVYGLSNHYRQIFELTRLNEAISIHADEVQALAAAG